MIDAAVEAGVKRFIPSDYGSVAENPEAAALDSRKGDCESIVEHLRSKESTGLTWTALITGLFFDLYDKFLQMSFGNKTNIDKTAC